ncbi:MAG: DUF6318 family protein [Dermatophilaceae bacterium]
MLTLGACTGGGDPPSPTTPVVTGTATGASTTATSTRDPSTAAATTAAPTPSVDPVLAKIPAAARPETPEGAEAFAKFYIGQLNAALSLADPAQVKGLFTEDCKGCTAFLQSAEKMKSNGQRHAGETLTVTDTSVISFVDLRKEIQVDATQNAVPVIDASGTKLRTTTADQGSFVLTLTYRSHWVVERQQVMAP